MIRHGAVRCQGGPDNFRQTEQGGQLPLPALENAGSGIYFLLRASSMAFAAVLPAPMARMTVAAPVTASPPA